MFPCHNEFSLLLKKKLFFECRRPNTVIYLWICQRKCKLIYIIFRLSSKLFASLMINNFPKRPLDTPLYNLLKFDDVTFGFVFPIPFDEWPVLCKVVKRFWMNCLFLMNIEISTDELVYCGTNSSHCSYDFPVITTWYFIMDNIVRDWIKKAWCM